MLFTLSISFRLKFLFCSFFFWVLLTFSYLGAQPLPFGIDTILHKASFENTPEAIISANARAAFILHKKSTSASGASYNSLFDSLLNQAERDLRLVPEADEAKMWIYAAKGGHYMEEDADPDSIIHYLSLSFDLAEKLDQDEVFSYSLVYIGVMFSELGRVEEQIQLAKRYYERAKAKADTLRMMDALGVIGGNYIIFGDVENAERYTKESYTLGRNSSNKIFNEKGTINLLNLYTTDIYEDEKHFEEVLRLRNELENLGPQSLTSKGRVIRNVLVGKVYLLEENYDKAREIFSDALQENQEGYEDKHLASLINQCLTTCYYHLEDYDKVIFYAKEGLAQIPEDSYTQPHYLLLNDLSNAYKEKQRWDSAYLYKEKHLAVYEEVRKASRVQYNQKLEKEFQSKLKDEQIAILEKGKEFNRKQNLLLLIGLGCSGVFFTVLASLYLAQRNQKKTIYLQKDQISSQADRLRELDTQKSNFFRNIAHELRTPLTLIYGPIQEILRKGDFDTSTTLLLHSVAKHSRQMISMLNQILHLGQMEQGALKLQLKPVRLGDVFYDLEAQYVSIAKNKNLSLGFTYLFDKDLLYSVDRYKFKIICSNLISNALKYTDEGGRIQVKIEVLKGELSFEVKDTGRGIPSSEINRVFDPYYQVDPINKIEGGSGIGLSICKQYVEMMGGEIEVQSEWEEGSMFRFRIPVKVSEGDTESVQIEKTRVPLVQQEERRELVEQTKTAYKILLLEDHLEMANFITEILSDLFQIAHVGNGKKALDYLATHDAPHMIISDLMMPEMDGWSFFKHVKSQPEYAGIPFVLLTARDNYADKITSLRMGIDDYLTKPFDPEVLILRIENILNNQKERAEYLGVMEEEVGPEEYNKLATLNEQWLEKLENTVRNSLGRTNLTVSDVADEMCISLPHFHRKTKSMIGMTPMQYIKNLRFQTAREMLEQDPYVSVKTVAFSVGYKAEKHFSRSFKHKFGKYPTEIQKGN